MMCGGYARRSENVRKQRKETKIHPLQKQEYYSDEILGQDNEWGICDSREG